MPPQTQSQGIPGTPNSPGKLTHGGHHARFPNPSPHLHPVLPTTCPWPELDGARHAPTAASPVSLRSAASSVSLLPSPRPSDVVLHLAVTEMGRIFIDAAERGKRISDREWRRIQLYHLLPQPRLLCILPGRPQPPR